MLWIYTAFNLRGSSKITDLCTNVIALNAEHSYSALKTTVRSNLNPINICLPLKNYDFTSPDVNPTVTGPSENLRKATYCK